MNVDSEMERRVIAALLLDGDLFGQLKKRWCFGTMHLSELQLQEVFAAMEMLFRDGVPIDAITVKDELRRRCSLDQVGGPDALIRIAETCRDLPSVFREARILIQLAKARRAAADASRLQWLERYRQTDPATSAEVTR